MSAVKNKKKLKRLFYILKNDFRYFLRRTEEVLLREMKEQDLQNFWKYLGSLGTERNQEEEAKVFLYVLSVFLLSIFITSGNFILTNNFRIQYGMTNVQASESTDLNLTASDKLNTDVESTNKYKLKPSEEICAEAKGQKQSSGLCGKDDEEELQRIAEEEKTEQRRSFIASRPRIVRISCGEKDLGDPSKSDTKGKHVDEDCCPDPDEWPKSGCVYNAKGYSVMLSGPGKSKH